MYCSYLYIRHKYKRWDKKKRKEKKTVLPVYAYIVDFIVKHTYQK